MEAEITWTTNTDGIHLNSGFLALLKRFNLRSFSHRTAEDVTGEPTFFCRKQRLVRGRLEVSGTLTSARLQVRLGAFPFQHLVFIPLLLPSVAGTGKRVWSRSAQAAAATLTLS